MSVFFVEPTPQPFARPPMLSSLKSLNWRRPAAVALTAAMAALLHGLLLVWYLLRPAPEPLVEAIPLPMIDIALAAPSTSAQAQPVVAPTPPKPVPAKPRPKPKAKPKLVKKPKQPSEIKNRKSRKKR